MLEAEPTPCDCGRTTCLDCLAQFAAGIESSAAPPAEATADATTAAPRHLGLKVEDRVGCLEPRDPRTRRELGALVAQVDMDGLGARLGIHAGDLIVAIDGAPVDCASAIRAALSRRGAGRPRVTVRRGAVRLELPLDD
jgi:S1-C subfamily serine protease